jgi:hypothetical protein
LPEVTTKEIEALPYPPEGLIPYDDTLVNLDLQGQALLKISSEAPSYRAVKEMLVQLGILN